MKDIAFSTNWNAKLDCNYFTTLRLHGGYSLGYKLRVLLKGKPLKTVEVVGKKALRMGQMNEFICGLDTGYGIEETKSILIKMYPDVDWSSTYLFLYLLKTLNT